MGLVLFGTSLSCVLFQIGPIELCLRRDGDDASTARAPENSFAALGGHPLCIPPQFEPTPPKQLRLRRPDSRGLLRRWVNNEDLFIISS